MRAVRPPQPVRQIVGIAVAVVEEAALFHDQLSCLRAGAPGVPAERPTAGGLRVQADRLAALPALLLDRLVLVVDLAHRLSGALHVRLPPGGHAIGVASPSPVPALPTSVN